MYHLVRDVDDEGAVGTWESLYHSVNSVVFQKNKDFKNKNNTEQALPMQSLIRRH